MRMWMGVSHSTNTMCKDRTETDGETERGCIRTQQIERQEVDEIVDESVTCH